MIIEKYASLDYPHVLILTSTKRVLANQSRKWNKMDLSENRDISQRDGNSNEKEIQKKV